MLFFLRLIPQEWMTELCVETKRGRVGRVLVGDFEVSLNASSVVSPGPRKMWLDRYAICAGACGSVTSATTHSAIGGALTTAKLLCMRIGS